MNQLTQNERAAAIKLACEQLLARVPAAYPSWDVGTVRRFSNSITVLRRSQTLKAVQSAAAVLAGFYGKNATDMDPLRGEPPKLTRRQEAGAAEFDSWGAP